ncbi:anti-repressor protein [Pilibacter termitis]|uniref:Anti-repressor protein n=1 Tax=Pilibacter termitis TaxID=263852 RepID=A0A1T4PRC0_9ENTE|nr:phage antirepressor KilAC domain-containing protein [Pilibacter termitis]SJZ94130.1 anti-repressor protein [Pilibacter termitis]
MNELIKVTTNEKDEQLVSGRELHSFLEIETPYAKWFGRMTEYGFIENVDYSCLDKNVQMPNGGFKAVIDHALKIEMAKEISMIQRNDKGKQARQYFLEVERQWNNPEMVVERALQIQKRKVQLLSEQVALQTQQISELQPKATYYDVVLNCKDLVAISTISKDYGWSATRMNKFLKQKKVQYKQGKIWLLYQDHAEQGYTSTKVQTYAGSDGATHTRPHTYWTQKGRLFIYNLLKEEGILPLIERGVA